MTDKKVSSKWCPSCKRTLPATIEYFRRSKANKDGLDRYCKKCVRRQAKLHYVPFGPNDIDRKGIQGAVCPLWTERCGVCTAVNQCWRLVHCGQAYFPEKMVGQLQNRG